MRTRRQNLCLNDLEVDLMKMFGKVTLGSVAGTEARSTRKLGFLLPSRIPALRQPAVTREGIKQLRRFVLRKRRSDPGLHRHQVRELLSCVAGSPESEQESDSDAATADDLVGKTSRYGGPVPSQPTRPFDASVVHPSWYINMRPDNPCVVCLGEGHIRCMHCNGAGYIVVGPEPDEFPERDRELCVICEGEGRHVCRRCDGSGKRPMWIFDPETRERRPITLERDLPWKKALMEIAEAELRRKDSENSTRE
jgi:hypothetical protein